MVTTEIVEVSKLAHPIVRSGVFVVISVSVAWKWTDIDSRRDDSNARIGGMDCVVESRESIRRIGGGSVVELILVADLCYSQHLLTRQLRATLPQHN